MGTSAMVRKIVASLVVGGVLLCAAIGTACLWRRLQHGLTGSDVEKNMQTRPVPSIQSSPINKLSKSPRSGQTYWGVDNAGGKVAHRIIPPKRTSITPAQRNEITTVFNRMAEAYRRQDRAAMLMCASELPDVVTNIPDHVFAQLVAPLSKPLFYEFGYVDGRMPHILKDFRNASDFSAYGRINLEVALFLGNMYLKRRQHDGCPLPILDAVILEQLVLYKKKFHAEGTPDIEKVADGFIEEWHEQIESENGFTRQAMWFQVDLQWERYNAGTLSLVQLSEWVKQYAKPLIRLGYTPKWLSEFDDLSEAVK